MTQETEDKLAGARSQAMAQYASIVEMVDALRAADDDDIYEGMAKSLAIEAGYAIVQSYDEDGDEDGFKWAKYDRSEIDDTSHEDEDTAWLACCDDNSLRPDADDARRAIEEDALSVEVRSDWQSVGEPMTAGEFRILLCTGGPAVQIRGELDGSEPSRAWLECQDWFTPWTQVFNVEQETLLAYARCFWFGE